MYHLHRACLVSLEGQICTPAHFVRLVVGQEAEVLIDCRYVIWWRVTYILFQILMRLSVFHQPIWHVLSRQEKLVRASRSRDRLCRSHGRSVLGTGCSKPSLWHSFWAACRRTICKFRSRQGQFVPLPPFSLCDLVYPCVSGKDLWVSLLGPLTCAGGSCYFYSHMHSSMCAFCAFLLLKFLI